MSDKKSYKIKTRNQVQRNPSCFIPPVDSEVMSRLKRDLKLELFDWVKYLNLNFSYGVRRAMEQRLFNVLRYHANPVEYQERYLYQVIFGMECRRMDYASMLAIAKNFIAVVDELRKGEIYESEVI